MPKTGRKLADKLNGTIDSVERVVMRLVEACQRISVYALIFVLHILGLVKLYEWLAR